MELIPDKMRTPYLISFFLFLFLISCEKPEQATTLSLKFKTDQKTNSSGKGISGEGILVDSAVIILSDIKFISRDDGLQDGYTFNGPFIINLLTYESRPEISSNGLIPGVYLGMKANLVVSELTGYSIYISGTYTSDNKWWKFIYMFSGTGDFSVENPDGFTITENMNNEIWVVINVMSLLEGIDFSKAQADNDNIIRIDSNTNPEIAALIQDNFGYSSQIGGDDINNEIPGEGENHSDDDQDGNIDEDNPDQNDDIPGDGDQSGNDQDGDSKEDEESRDQNDDNGNSNVPDDYSGNDENEDKEQSNNDEDNTDDQNGDDNEDYNNNDDGGNNGDREGGKKDQDKDEGDKRDDNYRDDDSEEDGEKGDGKKDKDKDDEGKDDDDYQGDDREDDDGDKTDGKKDNDKDKGGKDKDDDDDGENDGDDDADRGGKKDNDKDKGDNDDDRGDD